MHRAAPGARLNQASAAQLLSCRRDPLAARPSSGYSAERRPNNSLEPVQAAVRVRHAAPLGGDQQTAQRNQVARCLDEIAVCGSLAERTIKRGEAEGDVNSSDRLLCGIPAHWTPSPRSREAEMVTAGASPTRCRRAKRDGAAERHPPALALPKQRTARRVCAAKSSARISEAARLPRQFDDRRVPAPGDEHRRDTDPGFSCPCRGACLATLPQGAAPRRSRSSSDAVQPTLLGAAGRQQRQCRRGARHRRRAERRRQ